MRTPIAVVVLALGAACTQPHVSRLAPRSLPRIVDAARSGVPAPQPGVQPGAALQPNPDTTDPVTVDPLPTLPEVAPADVTEAEVIGFVEAQLAADGAAGLVRIQPGTTLVDRLRFCAGRLLMKRCTEVLPELERLASRHPDNPVVWRVLGLGYGLAGQLDRAVPATKRAHDLDAPTGFRRCPRVVQELGEQMLASPAHRAAGERLLRGELASGDRFEWAAIRLADLFSAQEKLADAIGCIDAGLERRRAAPRLLLRKALVLMDLYRVDEATALLQPMVQRAEGGIGAVEYCRRCRLLADDLDGALALTDRLLADATVTGDDRTRLSELREQTISARRTGKRVLAAWELFAILRGHPRIQARLEALTRLGRHESSSMASRALRIALASDVALLRLRALQILVGRSVRPLDDLKIGLGDADPKIRVAAADIAVQLGDDKPDHKSVLAAMVLDALADESNPYAFRNMHAALRKMTGARIELPFGGDADPAQRAAVVKAWRERR